MDVFSIQCMYTKNNYILHNFVQFSLRNEFKIVEKCDEIEEKFVILY